MKYYNLPRISGPAMHDCPCTGTSIFVLVTISVLKYDFYGDFSTGSHFLCPSYAQHLSNEKDTGSLVYIKGIILPSYVVIIANYYKDPYEPTSITESERFFFVAQLSSTLEKTQPPRFSLLVYATLLDSPAEVMSSLNEVGVVPCLPSGVWILR